MSLRAGLARFAFGVGIVLVACGPPPGSNQSSPLGARPPLEKKRLTAVVFSDPAGLYLYLTNPGGSGSVPGVAELHLMLNAGLTQPDDLDVLQPRLAEAVPSAENGLWKVLPDGRMETTWRLRPNLVWHDGTPFTSEDVVFSANVNRDKEIGIINAAALDLVEAVEAPDLRTVLVKWKTPFIEADSMFTPALVMPLPRHVLEKTFADDKPGFLNVPFWRQEFVGLGPFRLQDWTPGSHLTMVANDRYVLGRPQLDEVEVRFITDVNTVVANLLADAVQKPIGARFSLEQAIQLRDTAPNISVVVGGQLGGQVPIWPQFINPQPAIVANVEFRRAMLLAIDRQEMSDTINYGLGPVANTWLQPDRPEFKAIESSVVRYGYDARRAAQMIETLGYSRGSDGVFHDGAGQPLHLELRTTDQRLIQPRSAYSVADYWKKLGVDVETVNVPNQLIPDREYRVQFPAFELVTLGGTVKSTSVRSYHSTSAALPETRYQGTNRARYRNPALDTLIERYVSTIPIADRLSTLGEIIHHQTDQVTAMPLYFEGSSSVLGSTRVKGVTSDGTWNAHLWNLE